MATATKKKPAKKRTNKQAAQVNVAVGFGGVSFGDKTARLAVAIDREIFDIDHADDMFCDRRLTGVVVLGHAEDDPKQMLAFDDMEHVVRGVFDVKGFRVSAKAFALGLTFSLQEINRGELAGFAKSAGRLVITNTEDIPEDEKSKDSEAGDEVE